MNKVRNSRAVIEKTMKGMLKKRDWRIVINEGQTGDELVNVEMYDFLRTQSLCCQRYGWGRLNGKQTTSHHNTTHGTSYPGSLCPKCENLGAALSDKTQHLGMSTVGIIKNEKNS
jgi:hypothetical protein